MKRMLALLLAAALMLAALSGCSGSGSDKLIPANAFSTGDVLNLKLSADLNPGNYVSYGGHAFESTKKLSAMSELITKNNEGVTAELCENAYGACYLFSKPSDGVMDYWCLYQQDPANIKNFYIFVGAHRELGIDGDYVDMLLPLQYISDSYIRDSMGNRLALDTRYACGLNGTESTMQALFQDFYSNSGLYNVTANETGFLLVPKQGGVELQFTFEEGDASGFFTISDARVKEPEPTSNVTVMSDTMTEPVALSETDALTVSNLLIGASFAAGQGADGSLTIATSDTQYTASLSWAASTWSATVQNAAGESADLSSKDSCTLAAVLYAYGMLMVKDADSAPGDVTPLASCMATTTTVNVRDAASTSGTILETLNENSPVAVVGKSTGWYQVLYKDQLAYMSADYLKIVS